jgi:hypothetical protein
MTSNTDIATSRRVFSDLEPEAIAKILDVFESNPTVELELLVYVRMNSFGRTVPFDKKLRMHTSLVFHLEDFEEQVLPELQARIAPTTETSSPA